ncbi:MAG: hypothetical protein QOH35_347 [Acidobacteriaceae bacterium]|jgi:hypothetical protein|nr:hypothetical protein [Acidobacteriaceae bacterium]MEA2538981.1 hypothetical protein [Acidobacteriaceae bacterium]
MKILAIGRREVGLSSNEPGLGTWMPSVRMVPDPGEVREMHRTERHLLRSFARRMKRPPSNILYAFFSFKSLKVASNPGPLGAAHIIPTSTGRFGGKYPIRTEVN